MNLVNDSWARRAALGIGLLALSASLLVGGTMWAARERVRRASRALVRGEAEGVLRAVDEALERPPTDASLQATLRRFDGAGVRYVAFVEAWEEDAWEAGQPLLAPRIAPTTTTPRALSPGFFEAGERVRLVQPTFRAGGRRPGPRPFPPPGGDRDPDHEHDRPPHGRPPHPPLVVVELVPTVGTHLVAAFNDAAWVAGFAVLLLWVFAGLLARFTFQAAARAREAERARRLVALGEMSSIMAHELRNPVASLKGHAQLLVDDLAEGSDDRRRAERVVTETQRLERLTSELLAFVRDAPLARETIAVDDLLHRAVASFAALPKRVIIASDVPSAGVSVDVARLLPALENVLRNAVDAAREEVAIVASCDGGRLVVDVVDDGEGVPAGDDERIFEPFVTSRTRGTGLGLAIARRAVEQHGGTLTLVREPFGRASREAPGARFRFSLPSGGA